MLRGEDNPYRAKTTGDPSFPGEARVSGLAACPHCGRGFTRAALLDLQVLPPPDCPDCGGALRVRWQLPVSLFLTGTGIPISLVELTGSVPVGLASFTIVMALWFAAFPRLSPLAEGARR